MEQGLKQKASMNKIPLNKKKEIIVFAGPNGSGKSTITQYLQVKYEYINDENINKLQNCILST